ncbi:MULTISPECIES: hypothetical protein [Paenibacillus]|uniref:hypothetical protein n=1 Tax=Paenibacillus TaxID=44249 RepID=UPI00249CB36F|nr:MULTISPECIES: hypothetical protein [Paenibacillus]WFA84575.1 hypothetical protein OGI70_27185 [Paenibacillus amylolyticus]
MKKVFLLSILSLLLAVSVYAASASSDQKTDRIPNVNQPVTPITVEETDPIIVPFSTSPLFDTTLAGATTYSQFNVAAGYGHVKIYIKNSGKYSVRAVMVHEGTEKKEYFSKDIAPGATLDWRSFTDFPQGVRGGKYTITYRSDGNIMSGRAWGLSAENNNEL